MYQKNDYLRPEQPSRPDDKSLRQRKVQSRDSQDSDERRPPGLGVVKVIVVFHWRRHYRREYSILRPKSVRLGSTISIERHLGAMSGANPPVAITFASSPISLLMWGTAVSTSPIWL